MPGLVATRRPAVAVAAGNAALLGAWLWLHAPVLRWLGGSLVQSDHRLNGLLVAGILAAAAARGARRLSAAVATPAQPSVPALVLAVGSVLADRTVARPLDIDLLSASLFGLGTWGLAGLYLPRPAWLRALPLALLLVAVLPFDALLDTYLGFPARKVTAGVVGDLLRSSGVAAITSETILEVDTPTGPGAAHVDVPCAGMKSLWSGTLFLLAAALLERRTLGARLAVAGAVLYGLLVAANTLRVSILVVVGLVLGMPLVAGFIHVPLGVLGFAGSAGVAWGILRLGRPAGVAAPPVAGGRAWLAPLLAPGVLALGLGASPAPRTDASLPLPIALPASWSTAPVALVAPEPAFFTQVGLPAPPKFRFRVGDLSGVALLVPSRTWRAHHLPVQCLEGGGHEVDSPRTVLLDGRPVRLADVDAHTLTAVWWFQSPDRVTDDLAARVWADLRGEETRWVLVSLLFDARTDPRDPAARALLDSVYEAVDDALGDTP
jgi:exosortase O